MNNRWAKFWVMVIASGASQFALLVTAGITHSLPLIAGVFGTMGTTAVGLLTTIPNE